MDDKKTDKQTVFVRGVSFDADDQDFNDFFSDIGPVRQAFLVKSKGGAKHKGFGFVHFALQEDAERAAAELNGKELKGRRIQVEVALKRAPLEERKKKRKQQVPEEDGNQEDSPPATEQPPPQPQQEEQPPPAKKAKPARPAHGGGGQQGAAEAKHKMVRAVAVGRLTPDTLASAVSLAKAAGEVEEIINPLPQSVLDHCKLERDGCSGNAFLAVYSSVKHAMAAVAKLHGQPATQDSVAGAEGGPSGGKKKKKKGGKQQSGAAGEEGSTAGPGGVVMWARQVSGEGLHLKRWRLIVRNLPFQVSEAELHAAFDPAGFVWELTLPRSADGKARGFAFVGFTCRAHAEQGIRLVNGQQVAGRPVAVDWALSKAQFAAAGKPAGGAPGEGEAKEANGLDGLDSDDEQPLAAKAAGGRLPGHESDSDEDAAADVAPEQEHAMLHSVIDDILGSGTASLGNGPAAAATAAAAGGKAKSAAGEAGRGVRGSDQDGGKPREEGEDPGGGDMFSKEALQKRSAAQRAALERLDRQLQSKPLGKAVAAAAAAAEAANKEAGADAEEQAGAGGAAAKQAQRERPEGVTVFVRGLPLDVSKQQLHTKMQAFGKVLSCRLVVDKASGRLKGTAFVDFADAQAAHKVAEACAKARRKEGPGVIVAGRTVDVDLALGHDDIRSLAAQKASERGPRDKRNLYLVKERASKADPRVKQVKILVEEERAGAGVPRSKGIGFVEFEDQEHALCALRQLNNNPKPWSKERRPIVEFAIENAKILKAREAKLARMKQQQQPQQQAEQQQTEQPPSEAGGADSGQGGPPVKRLRTERGSQRQPGGEAAEQAQQQELGEGGGGGDEAAQDGPAQQVPAQQQSKRQRRKEIKLKLRAVKQQKLQEAAAAAAAGEQQGANGVAAQPGEGGAHNKAKKRREQRKAKKQGTAASVAGPATATPASPAAAPASGSKQPARQAAGHASGGKPQQQQQRPPRGVGKGAGQLKQQQGQQPARPATTGGVNSRAAKGKQQVQREQQAQQRKRRSDETLDSLVASVPGGQRQPNKPRQKGDKPDRLDKLAAEYRAKFFDGGSKGKAGGKAAAKGGAQQPANGLRLGLKRWFE